MNVPTHTIQRLRRLWGSEHRPRFGSSVFRGFVLRLSAEARSGPPRLQHNSLLPLISRQRHGPRPGSSKPFRRASPGRGHLRLFTHSRAGSDWSPRPAPTRHRPRSCSGLSATFGRIRADRGAVPSPNNEGEQLTTCSECGGMTLTTESHFCPLVPAYQNRRLVDSWTRRRHALRNESRRPPATYGRPSCGPRVKSGTPSPVGGRRARNILAIPVGGGRPDGLFNSERGNLWCLIRRGEPKTTRRS